MSVSTKSQAIWSRPSTMKPANRPASTPQTNEAPVERAIERPERQRKPRQAENLAGVLDAPGRRAAIGKSQRRDQPARGAPATIAEIKHPAEPAKRQHGKGDGVGLLEARRRDRAPPAADRAARRSATAGRRSAACRRRRWASRTATVPLCSAWARKASCGWKCALESQGIVTCPDSHGQAR